MKVPECYDGKGIVYYSHSLVPENIAIVCRKYVRQSGLPIVSVTHYPVDLGENYVVDMPINVFSMFKQTLIGLEKNPAKYIFFCEHDVLYHPSHFDFIPPTDDVYYYNMNVWHIDTATGKALTYNRMKMTSGLCCHRDIAIAHYTEKIERIEREGFSRRRLGFEPGKNDPWGWEEWRSEHPNLNMKHGMNVTPKRFKLDEYRCKNRIKDSWVMADEVQPWGRTRKRFNEFLRELY